MIDMILAMAKLCEMSDNIKGNLYGIYDLDFDYPPIVFEVNKKEDFEKIRVAVEESAYVSGKYIKHGKAFEGLEIRSQKGDKVCEITFYDRTVNRDV